MKSKPLPTVESESLELARIVTRERELLLELAALKVEKSKRIASIQQLAATAVPELERAESKKEQVQRVVFGYKMEDVITTSEIAGLVDIDPDIVSNYLSWMVKTGYLRRIARGRFVLERTVM